MVSLVFLDILQLPHTVISNYEKLTYPKVQCREAKTLQQQKVHLSSKMKHFVQLGMMSTFHLEVMFLFYRLWTFTKLLAKPPTCHPCYVSRYPSECSNNSWKDSRLSHQTPCQSRRWGRGWTPRRLSGSRSWGRGRQPFFCPGGP